MFSALISDTHHLAPSEHMSQEHSGPAKKSHWNHLATDCHHNVVLLHTCYTGPPVRTANRKYLAKNCPGVKRYTVPAMAGPVEALYLATPPRLEYSRCSSSAR